MAEIDLDALRKGIAYGAIGFGAAAVLVPRTFLGVYGLRGDGNLRAMTRLWGTRTALLGGLALTATDPTVQRTLVTGSAVLNVADSVLTLRAGPDVRLRTRLMGSATSAGFAGACAYWLSQKK